jgi:DNA-binding MarR family transcriptional regulator
MRPTDRVQIQIDRQEPEFPQLDYSAKAVTGRIIRLATLFVEGLQRAVAPFGISSNEYAILTTLRANGPPYALPPKAINQSLILTSGGMTNILNAMERRGLIERLPDPDDGRGVLVRLTASALAFIEEAIAAHLAEEHRMLAALSAEERRAVETLLAKLLVDLDPVPAPNPCAPAVPSGRAQRR